MKFVKMHGLGNDFMMIDAIHQKVDLTKSEISALAKRDTGIGFDQCLFVEKSLNPDIDFFYRIFNADGQEVGQCGNGARCLARFIKAQGLSSKNEFRVATKTTQMTLILNEDESVSVEMGIPRFDESPLELPLKNGKVVALYTLDIGNPHAVQPVTSIDENQVRLEGKEISEHPHFKEGTNAGFMQILSPSSIKLQVYERGSGLTKACGSGAVAAAIVGRQFFQMEEKINVSLPGGELTIEWVNDQSPVFLTGPAVFVYQGFV